MACSSTRSNAGLVADHPRAADHLPQSPILFAQLGFIERVLQREQNFFAAQRLLQKIESARARRLHRVGDGAVARDHQHRRIDVVGSHPADQIDAAAVRQTDIDQIGVGALRLRLGFGDARARRYGVAFALQNQPQRAADIFFVVDDQVFASAPFYVPFKLPVSRCARCAVTLQVHSTFLPQQYSKRRAAQFAVERLNIAAAQQRAAASDRKAQAHAAFLERNGRLEQARSRLRAQPRAGIVHFDVQFRAESREVAASTVRPACAASAAFSSRFVSTPLIRSGSATASGRSGASRKL